MRPFHVAIPAWGLLFAFAFVAAPRSCEWGLTAYSWAGVGVTLGLGVLPFFLPSDMTVARRVLISVGLLIASIALWLAGLFAANVRIMCRLF